MIVFVCIVLLGILLLWISISSDSPSSFSGPRSTNQSNRKAHYYNKKKSLSKSGKTYIDQRGYSRFANSGDLVHRWVAQKKLGRKLRKGEVVHHVNRNKLDNKKGNLKVFPNQAAHHAQHMQDAQKYGKRNSFRGFNR